MPNRSLSPGQRDGVSSGILMQFATDNNQTAFLTIHFCFSSPRQKECRGLVRTKASVTGLLAKEVVEAAAAEGIEYNEG